MHRTSPVSYEQFFVNQAGSGLPVFHGAEFQRGHGLANIFSGVAKLVMPLVKSGVKAIGRQALTSGARFVGDVLDGKNAKQAAVKRSKQAGKALLQSMISTPSGSIKRKRPAKTIRTKKAKRRRGQQDIFS